MLTIREVKKRYGDLEVLGGVSLEAADGDIVALAGPSGCGKTTLLDMVAGLTRPDAGTVDAGGSRVGYVFQEDRLLPWLTVEENIAIVGGGDGRGVAELIDLVGLGGFERYFPDALSGGMRQRCAIARAYHYHCDLLLMDEPFKSLDPGLRSEMLDALLNVWKRRRNAVLFVTHDLDEALAIASRIVVLSPRPARVRAEFTLGATETVRDPAAPELADTRQRLLDALGAGLW